MAEVLSRVIAGRAESITHRVIASVIDLAPTMRRQHQHSTEEKHPPNQVSQTKVATAPERLIRNQSWRESPGRRDQSPPAPMCEGLWRTGIHRTTFDDLRIALRWCAAEPETVRRSYK